MRRSIHVLSLGCAKNRVDTEVMLGVSEAMRFAVVQDPAEAEVIVVNTCGFIDSAKRESIEAILRMEAFKQEGRCKKLVVTGCLSQRYADDLAESLPGVDHFLGSSDMLKLGEVLAGGAERLLVGNPADYLLRASDPRRVSLRPHSVYVKLAEGCNRTCSFCAIPAMRGKQRSRSVEDLRREVEQLAAQGAVEISLISQDTVAYGRDLQPRASLAQAVEALAEVPGIRWLRLHYLYPETLDDALLELLAQHPRVLPYVDMPLQHAASNVLRRMRRGHGGARIRRVIETLRQRVPGLTLRTTFLVGHPGETAADFDELLALVRWAEFDHMGVFRYSAEEGTAAATQADAVPAAAAGQRQRRLMAAQQRISHKKLRAMVGQELQVLVDGPSDESEWLLEGRHAGQALEVDGKVVLANGTARPGEFRRARVVDHGDYDLIADLSAPDGSFDAPSQPSQPTLPAKRRKLPVMRHAP